MTEDQINALKFLREAGAKPDAGAIRRACAILSVASPEEALPPLFACFWAASGLLRGELHDLLWHLATALPLSLWPKVDEGARDLWNYRGPVATEDVIADNATVLVALCHPSGRVREQAITMIAVLPPSLAASLLLVRLNDWANPVREQAHKGVETILAKLSPPEKMRLAPLVARLRECGRFFYRFSRQEAVKKRGEDIERWLDYLAASFDASEWIRLWNSSHGQEQRAYLELLKCSQEKPGPAIRKALFGGNSRSALLWYLQDGLLRLDEGERQEAMRAIVHSRAVPVRKLWLARQIETDLPAATTGLVAGLTDRSRSLREFSRYHLARIAPRDFVEHYEEKLADSSLEPWALRGLAEVSPAAGHREALRRLDAPDPRVRRAAIECLDADTLGDHLDLLLREIQVPASGPAKAARKRLGSLTAILGAELLGTPDRFLAATPAAQEYLLSLAPFYRKWQGLEFLLRAAGDPVWSERSRRLLEKWLLRESRAFIRLAPAKRSELLALLGATEFRGSSMAMKLRYVLERAEA